MKFSTIIKLFCIALLITSCVGRHRYPPRIPGIPGTQQPYSVGGRTYYPLPSSQGYSQVGIASWYGKKFHGRPTANGERYNMYAMTAAHRTLPMNTYVLVENLHNGKKTVVRINDRGPFVKNRIIDLSYAAAKALNFVAQGTAKVRVTALGEAKLRSGRPHFKHVPDLSSGRFFVQVGAFKKNENALRLAQVLSGRYGKVRVQHRWTPYGMLYGVQVYGGSTYTRAKAMEKRLEHAGFLKAFVVAD